ncbi:hypothetical protein KIPB_016363, partial [Kipferlia bialata]|eukprot:g16363.t1
MLGKALDEVCQKSIRLSLLLLETAKDDAFAGIHVARTHGQLAQPRPLRHLFHTWAIQLLSGALPRMSLPSLPGKLSGAVGSYEDLVLAGLSREDARHYEAQ